MRCFETGWSASKLNAKVAKAWVGTAVVVRFATAGYLRGMKLTRTNLWLAAATAMLLTASCSQAPDAAEAEKDPSADATYKRAHRAEGYREAQRSNVTRN
jgi:hypothetical protein